MTESIRTCCELVREKGPWPRLHPCKSVAKVCVDNKWYCATHNPVRRQEKRKVEQDRWNQKLRDRRVELAGPLLYTVLKAIQFGDNDRCPACGGWDEKMSQSKPRFHGTGCPVETALDKAEGN